ncbi:hypothetical protein NEOLEDRAFT_69094 [Neolentinus lepideus HHB14362 ss-1]|uniref:CHAT domain-containing protein n=1 Tax=Neolentinus lepideus HHB14362 ss-1 TaxID=1314782 RepID=A0A165UBF0_9AGAM|nr:hypothetical protein NEOLEDRAFT_69094 [Neolentinus lepideus HHB14362 ss-1]
MTERKPPGIMTSLRRAKLLCVAVAKTKGFESPPKSLAETRRMKNIIDSDRLIALYDGEVSQGASWGSFLSVLGHTFPVAVSRITQMPSRADCSCPMCRDYSFRSQLSDPMKLDLPSAQFVLLSACPTDTGDIQPLDEYLHLAGGFLLSGFKSTITT